jgi:hypothetical protein
MPGDIQRAFASGEVSPTLYGRVDVDRWAQALKTCRNWIVDPEGGVHTRQGFEYIGRVPVGNAGSGLTCTLAAIPFEFSPSDSAILLGNLVDESAYVIKDGTIVTGDPIKSGTDVVTGTNTHTFTTILPHGYVTGDTVLILDGEKAGSSGTITRTDDYVFYRTIASSTNGTYRNIKFVRTAKVSGSLGYMQIPCLLCGNNRYASIVSSYTTRYVQSADTIFTASVNWAHGVRKIVRENYVTLGITREKSFFSYSDGNASDFYQNYLSAPPIAYNSAVAAASTGAGTDAIRYIVTYTDIYGVESAALRVGSATDTPFSGTYTGTTTWTVAVNSHGLETNESIIIAGASHMADPSYGEYTNGDVVRVTKIDANSFSITGDGIPFSGSRTLYYWKCMDCNNAAVFPASATPVTVSWTAVPGANTYNIYREWGRVFGYIGSTAGLSFVDKGIIPDTKDTPSFGKRPHDSQYDSPAAIGSSQQRIFLGGWYNDSERIVSSYTGDYSNFEPGAADSSGLDFGLAGRTVSGVLHMTEVAGRLVVLTNTSEWIIKGGPNGLTPTAINARADSYNGCGEAAPVVVGTSLIYVQRGDRIVRDAQYDYQQEALTSRDLTLWAKHLFTPEIKKVVYQRGQQHLWALMWDGTLRCLTYIPDQNIWGWHRHDIEERTIDDICVVSESGADRLYIFCVYDGYVEIGRLPLDWESGVVDDYCGFDMSLSYNGIITTSTATLSGGTDWTTDETLSLSASVATFVAGDVGKDFLLTKGDDLVYVTCTAYTSNVLVSVVGRSIIPTSMQGVEVPASAWYRCATTFSGLGHLNGSTLGIIADGGVEPDQVPTGGAITTERPFARLRAGLKITQDVATLPLEPSDQDTSLGDFKHVTRVILRILDTRGLQGGINEDELSELVSEYSGLPSRPPELQSGTREILMSATHEDEGSVLLRQDKGLPSSVLNARMVFNKGSDR